MRLASSVRTHFKSRAERKVCWDRQQNSLPRLGCDDSFLRCIALRGCDLSDIRHTSRQPHQRGDAIGTNATLLRIRGEYRILETLSQNARYRAMKIDPHDLAEAERNFDILRAHLRGRMGLPIS